jgi:hypothetical protein
MRGGAPIERLCQDERKSGLSQRFAYASDKSVVRGHVGSPPVEHDA